MRFFLCTIILLSTFSGLRAQSPVTIPFLFTSDNDNKFLRENDSVRFFVANDTSKIVGMNDDSSIYFLYSKDKKLIDTGPFIMEGDKFLQEGKWAHYYSNGTIKVTGYYRRSKPVGTWQEYYPNGKPKAIYNFGICIDEMHGATSCLSGSFQQFYENGEVKVTGFYAAVMTPVTDTEYVIDPVTGETLYKLMPGVQVRPGKTGHWEYFKPDGELEKKEDIIP